MAVDRSQVDDLIAMVYGIMISEIQIANYKSIKRLKLSLGRVNVFIGENGCGKSNILEAIALSSASANDKLDNEFLAPRGIRVTEPQFMRSAFDKSMSMQDIKIRLEGGDGAVFNCSLRHDNHPYSKWVNSEAEGSPTITIEEAIEYLEKHKEALQAAGQNGNLNFRRAGVAFLGRKFLHKACFFFSSNRHRGLLWF